MQAQLLPLAAKLLAMLGGLLHCGGVGIQPDSRLDPAQPITLPSSCRWRSPRGLREGGLLFMRKRKKCGPYRDTYTAKFWTRIDKRGPDDCWPWTKSLTEGYGNATLYKQRVRAHRASWILTHGPILDGLWVLHSCDNRKCCNPAHLFLGTRKDNMDDMYAKERHLRGEKCHSAVLNAGLVREIRSRSKGGERNASIGKALGVSGASVSDVLLGKTWKHVV